MILGLGIDVLENRRVEQELLRGEWLLGDGVFTPEEISFCSSARKPALRYAACFAAKEATLKALGIPVSDLGMFREVEVGLGTGCECRVVLHDRLKAESNRMGVQHIRLSITRNRNHTGAMVVLEA